MRGASTRAADRIFVKIVFDRARGVRLDPRFYVTYRESSESVATQVNAGVRETPQRRADEHTSTTSVQAKITNRVYCNMCNLRSATPTVT